MMMRTIPSSAPGLGEKRAALQQLTAEFIIGKERRVLQRGERSRAMEKMAFYLDVVAASEATAGIEEKNKATDGAAKERTYRRELQSTQAADNGNAVTMDDVMMMKTVPSSASNLEEKRVALQQLTTEFVDAKERRVLQQESDHEIMEQLAFHLEVVVPSEATMQSTKNKKQKRMASEAIAEQGAHHRGLQSTQDPDGKIFCATLDDGSFSCVVEPNFPEVGVLALFLGCIQGGTLADCQSCGVARVCCIDGFESGVTEFCESCGVCSVNSVNYVSYGCSGSSCPQVDCSNTCEAPIAPTPSPGPLEQNPDGKIFCATLDDGSFSCVVEPNFPEAGVLTLFLDCVNGGTLADCQSCGVAKVCCIDDFESGVTEFCESCGVCSVNSVNYVSYGCSGSSCPQVDCSNTCEEEAPTPNPTPPPTPSPIAPPTPTLAQDPDGKIFCATLDDGSFSCVVEPNFPEEGVITIFLACIEGGTLADCQSCGVARVCCIDNFESGETEFCESCSVCSLSATNYIAYACSGNSCPQVDCSNTCEEEAPTPNPTPPPIPPPTPSKPPPTPASTPACDRNIESLAGCFVANNCNLDQCFDAENYENVNGCGSFNQRACRDIACCPDCSNAFESTLECVTKEFGVSCDVDCSVGDGTPSVLLAALAGLLGMVLQLV